MSVLPQKSSLHSSSRCSGYPSVVSQDILLSHTGNVQCQCLAPMLLPHLTPHEHKVKQSKTEIGVIIKKCAPSNCSRYRALPQVLRVSIAGDVIPAEPRQINHNPGRSSTFAAAGEDMS